MTPSRDTRWGLDAVVTPWLTTAGQVEPTTGGRVPKPRPVPLDRRGGENEPAQPATSVRVGSSPQEERRRAFPQADRGQQEANDECHDEYGSGSLVVRQLESASGHAHR